MADSTKQTGIPVKLTGRDGNAMVLAATCTAALKESNLPREEQARIKAEFMDEVFSGDYNHVLTTCNDYFVVS